MTHAPESSDRHSNVAGPLRDMFSALQRLDQLLERAVAVAQRSYGQEAANDPFRGLHIDPQEVENLLTRTPGVPILWTQETQSDTTAKAAVPHECSPLGYLQDTFGLTSFAVDALLTALAPEIDLRYERLYAFLQDDVTKKRPSVDLVLNLLCATVAEKLAARQHFSPLAPLRKHQLLTVTPDPSSPQAPLLAHYLKVDDRIVSYLLGAQEIDARITPYVQLVTPRARLSDLLLPADGKEHLLHLVRSTKTAHEQLVLYFHGPVGTGKQTTAEALCRELDSNLLVIDCESLLQSEPASVDTMIQLALREALLQPVVLYIEHFSLLLADEKKNWQTRVTRELVTHPGIVFLAGDMEWEPVELQQHAHFARFTFHPPTSTERLQLWQRTLQEKSTSSTDIDLQTLATQFRLTGGQIVDAVTTARSLAARRHTRDQTLSTTDLRKACQLQSNRTLARLAQKITPCYRWNDIVLPTDRFDQLREICHAVQHRARVYEDWGFEHKLSLGKGLNVLFAGPSGTGKTMAAEVIACELGLDLYKIDLSTIVSKYIGETEKNLARIFAEATTSNAILFFDEADALFGKRSDVRDAHDRYANIEVSYLLQKMEEYDGVVILATNFRKNIDDAFVRRLHFTIEFPVPGERDRSRIWQQIWPDTTPCSSALDLEFMAQRFDLAGGNIRNIALAATFLAAANGGVVSMEHLLHATKREYQKMGKIVSESEFHVVPRVYPAKLPSESTSS